MRNKLLFNAITNSINYSEEITVSLDCWQSVFLSKFSGYSEARRFSHFSLKGNGTKHGHSMHSLLAFPTLACIPYPLVFAMAKHSSKWP